MKSKQILFFILLCLVSACSSNKYETVNSAEEAAKLSKTSSKTKNESSLFDNNKYISDRVFFGFDKSDINNEAKITLDSMAEYLLKNQAIQLLIEGHTDERGTREYNISLGQKRAAAVKKYLVAKGIDAKRIKIISYGKEKPEFFEANEESWAKNRRAVSVVISSKK